ncbi:hypothetical protein ACH5AO_30075 [Streptomyces sp. NPDC018964]|uniref:hypothetical protein n=1 Tax=Streptomyces sp. NPDC018964 TaxID=3365058 RepID=UPI0037A3AF13
MSVITSVSVSARTGLLITGDTGFVEEGIASARAGRPPALEATRRDATTPQAGSDAGRGA